jgi:hypothetical protein
MRWVFCELEQTVRRYTSVLQGYKRVEHLKKFFSTFFNRGLSAVRRNDDNPRMRSAQILLECRDLLRKCQQGEDSAASE